MSKLIRTFSKDESLVEQRRKHIVECTATLFFNKGYSESSIRQIAEACGMSKGLIYHYIGKKEDILELMVDYVYVPSMKMYEQVTAALLDNKNITDSLVKTLWWMYREVDSIQIPIICAYREMYRLGKEKRAKFFESETKAIYAIQSLLDKGCKTGEFEIDDTQLIAHEIIAQSHLWPLRRWFLKTRYSLDEYAEKMIVDILRRILPLTNNLKHSDIISIVRSNDFKSI